MADPAALSFEGMLHWITTGALTIIGAVGTWTVRTVLSHDKQVTQIATQLAERHETVNAKLDQQDEKLTQIVETLSVVRETLARGGLR